MPRLTMDGVNALLSPPFVSHNYVRFSVDDPNSPFHSHYMKAANLLMDTEMAERAQQIEKIRSLADIAEKAADAYIAKSFKGNKSPSSWAGLDRVNGATRLKLIAAELKKLEEVNVVETQKVQEQGANEALENPQVKERNINEIAAKNGINILNDNTANKNYKRTVAKDGPVAGPKQTVKTGPGMGNTGN